MAGGPDRSVEFDPKADHTTNIPLQPIQTTSVAASSSQPAVSLQPVQPTSAVASLSQHAGFHQQSTQTSERRSWFSYLKGLNPLNSRGRPTHWSSSKHHHALLSFWDEATGSDDDSKLAATVQRMTQQFSELGRGDVPLTKEWVASVRDKRRRQQETIDVLVAGAGSRGNWAGY